MTRRAHSQGGFTLLEVMIAMGILVTIVGIIWGTLDNVQKLSKSSQTVEELYRGVRLATGRLVRDLSMAYVSLNDDPMAQEKRTFFVLENHSTSDEVRFTTMGHMRLYADANESDQTAIRYYLAPDPLDRDKQDLMRFESKRLDNKAFDRLPGDTEILMHDVVGLDLKVFDPRDKEWKEEWSTVSADGQPNRLPDRVRIKLKYKDELGAEKSLTTETGIYMQEVLNLQAN